MFANVSARGLIMGFCGIVFQWTVCVYLRAYSQRNDITCVVVSSCQDWIVTADSGQYDAILNIWDSRSRYVSRTSTIQCMLTHVLYDLCKRV